MVEKRYDTFEDEKEIAKMNTLTRDLQQQIKTLQKNNS